MIKTILPFYIICFALYVFFSRQPDFQDGKFTTGIIQYSTNKNQQSFVKARFAVNKETYTINASYPLRKLSAGQNISVIYDSSNPAKAALYKWWGYWIQWDELLASIFIPFILFFAANAITKDPTPEPLINHNE